MGQEVELKRSNNYCALILQGTRAAILYQTTIYLKKFCEIRRSHLWKKLMSIKRIGGANSKV